MDKEGILLAFNILDLKLTEYLTYLNIHTVEIKGHINEINHD